MIRIIYGATIPQLVYLKTIETSSELGDQIVCSDSHTKGKLLAGKLVVSYPLT